MNKLAALGVMLAVVAYGPANAQFGSSCQGGDYRRTVAIIEAAHLGGLRIGFSNADFGTKMSEMIRLTQELNSKADQLPPACQAIIKAIGDVIGKPSSGGPMCKGGVCCDNGGCYGG